jgi:REP element-mobilizing transposase RayT
MKGQQVFGFARKKRRHGKRPGRKPKGPRAGVPHRLREFQPGKPLHVTLRVVSDMPRLRKRHIWKAILWAMAISVARPDFRICHVSVQGNHIHLIVEAESRQALARGMQGFQISCAKQMNARIVVAGVARRGKVFADRYHAEVLANPTQVRAALRYVLNNWRRHREDVGRARLDPFATGLQFGGWSDADADVLRLRPGMALLPTSYPTTWLLTTGWKRGGGLISPWERPGPEAG